MKSYHPTSKTTYNIRKEIYDNIENLNISELSKKYVAIDRATRVVFVEIHPDKDAGSSSTFLANVTAYYPFDI